MLVFKCVTNLIVSKNPTTGSKYTKTNSSKIDPKELSLSHIYIYIWIGSGGFGTHWGSRSRSRRFQSYRALSPEAPALQVSRHRSSGMRPLTRPLSPPLCTRNPTEPQIIPATPEAAEPKHPRTQPRLAQGGVHLVTQAVLEAADLGSHKARKIFGRPKESAAGWEGS